MLREILVVRVEESWLSEDIGNDAQRILYIVHVEREAIDHILGAYIDLEAELRPGGAPPTLGQ